MIAYPPEGWSTHERNLEGGKRPEDLVRWLYDDVYTLLSTWRRTAVRAHRLVKMFGGKIEVSGLKLQVAESHWAALLDALLDDLDEAARAQGLRVALFWEAALGMLGRLRQESYIVRVGSDVTFSFDFLRTWWKRERAL
jgi:hypothetical protein